MNNQKVVSGQPVKIIESADLKKEEIVGCHPNDNHATLFLKFDDLVRYVKSCGHTITYIKVWKT